MQCKHDVCTCVVADRGGFCSETCSIVGEDTRHCPCGHAECEGAASRSGGPVQL